MSCFTTGGPGKEHRTNKPPPTRRVQEGSKGDTTCPITSQNPSVWHPFGWTTSTLPGRTLESEWLVKDNLETNPITIKPKTASHAAELFSWVPLPYCSPPGCPFPIKSLALLAHLSPRTIHFRVLDMSPDSGPGRGPPSCNNLTHDWHDEYSWVPMSTFPSPSFWTMHGLVYIHVFCFPYSRSTYCSCLARIGNACITYKIEALSFWPMMS